MKSVYLFSIMAAAMCLAVGCQKMTEESSDVLMESLEIVYPDDIADKIYKTGGTDTYSMVVGETISLGYNVSPDESTLTYPGVEWTSDNAETAEVTKGGVVTALEEGTAIITLSAADDRNGVADAVLRIEVSEKVITVTSIEIVSDSELEQDGLPACYVGETMTLTATVLPEDATYGNVTWSMSDEQIATVDSDGVVTGISAGKVTITASSVDGSDVSAEIDICILEKEPVKVSEITVSVEDGGLNACYVGGTIQLSASVAPEDAADKSVEWTSSDDEVATVDENGLVTGLKAGEVLITATATDDDTDPAKGEITLYVDAEVEFSLSNVEGTSLTLPAGGSFEFETELSEGTTGVSYSWNSSDTEIATVSGGVLSVLDTFGETQVTVKCIGNTAHGLDFEKTVDVYVTVPVGYYAESLPSAERVYWTLNSSHVENGATADFVSGSAENYLLVTPYSDGSKGRADLQHKVTYIDGTNYPVICFRFDDLHDDGYTCNINLDTSGTVDGTKFSGWIGGNNNKWAVKYSCTDDSAIIVYDLTSQSFQNGGSWPEGEIGTFTTFQLKYADMTGFSDVSELQYRFFWFKTFSSMEELEAHLADWSASTGIGYEIVD